MQLESSLDWGHVTPWLDSSNGLLVTKVDLTMCLQCACLLPVSLKSLQLVTKLSLKSLQLVTKLSLKSLQLVTKCFTSERPPECLSPTVPLFVTKHPHACQQCPLKKGTYTHHDVSKCNWDNQVQLKQPCSFYSAVSMKWHNFSYE